MIKKALPYINIGLASIMLFFALPKLGTTGSTMGEVFWIAWTVICVIAMASNGNVILMSDEKKERLRQIKRERALRLEQKLLRITNKQEGVEAKKRVKHTAS